MLMTDVWNRSCDLSMTTKILVTDFLHWKSYENNDSTINISKLSSSKNHQNKVVTNITVTDCISKTNISYTCEVQSIIFKSINFCIALLIVRLWVLQ